MADEKKVNLNIFGESKPVVKNARTASPKSTSGDVNLNIFDEPVKKKVDSQPSLDAPLPASSSPAVSPSSGTAPSENDPSFVKEAQADDPLTQLGETPVSQEPTNQPPVSNPFRSTMPEEYMTEKVDVPPKPLIVDGKVIPTKFEEEKVKYPELDYKKFAQQTEDRSKIHQQAFNLTNNKSFAASNAVLDIAEKKFPDDPYVHQLRAYNLSKMNNQLGSKNEIDKAIAKAPTNVDLYAEKAMTDWSVDKIEESRKAATTYLKNTENQGHGDETMAMKKAQMYSILGDEKQAKYWKSTHDSLKESRLTQQDAKTLQSLPDYLLTSPYMGAGLAGTAESVSSGVDKLTEAVTGQKTEYADVKPGVQQRFTYKLSPVERLVVGLSGAMQTGMALGAAVPAGSGIPTVLEKVGAPQAVKMTVGFLAPELFEFNLALKGAEMVLPSKLTQAVTAPMTTAMNAMGYDAEKLNLLAKEGISALDMIGFITILHGAKKIGNVIPDAEQPGYLKFLDEVWTKYKNGEPLKPEEASEVVEAVADADKETFDQAEKMAQQVNNAKKDTEQVQQVQNDNPDVPTYSIGSEMYPTKEAFEEAISKFEEKPTYNVVGDPQTKANVDAMFEPKEPVVEESNKVEPVNYEEATKLTPTSDFSNLPQGYDEASIEARSQAARNAENTPPKYNPYPIGTYAVDRFGELHQLQSIPIDEVIVKNEGTQRTETIDKYSKWQKESGNIPPVKGVENYDVYGGKVVITDGNHRVLAAKQNGLKEIPVWVSLTDPRNTARPLKKGDIKFYESVKDNPKPYKVETDTNEEPIQPPTVEGKPADVEPLKPETNGKEEAKGQGEVLTPEPGAAKEPYSVIKALEKLRDDGVLKSYNGGTMMDSELRTVPILLDAFKKVEQRVTGKTTFMDNVIQGIERGKGKPGKEWLMQDGYQRERSLPVVEFDDSVVIEAVKKVKNELGVTDNPREAGYIDIDGDYLDFSGKKDGGPSGKRAMDHREIDLEGIDLKDYKGGNWEGSNSGQMYAFVEMGNIRTSPERGGIEMSRRPTQDQFTKLREYIKEFKGEVILDIRDGKQDASIEYNRGTPTDVIIDNIKDFYKGRKEFLTDELYQKLDVTPKGAIIFVNDAQAFVKLWDGADVSTLAHELAGHTGRRFLEYLSKFDEQFGKDYQVIQKWAGVKDGKWTTKAEERFARGFEKYLKDGKAPIPELNSVFRRLANWMKEIYKNVKDNPLNVKLNPEVREVFDRMLGKEAEVKGEVPEKPHPESPAYTSWQAKYGDDPLEIIDAYNKEIPELANLKPWQIDVMGMQFRRDDFYNLYDSNVKRDVKISSKWFTRDKVDDIASVSEYWDNVSPTDIMNFILDHPNKYVRKTTDAQGMLLKRLRDITGLKGNDVIEQYNKIMREERDKAKPDIPNNFDTFMGELKDAGYDVDKMSYDDLIKAIEDNEDYIKNHFVYEPQDFDNFIKHLENEREKFGERNQANVPDQAGQLAGDGEARPKGQLEADLERELQSIEEQIATQQRLRDAKIKELSNDVELPIGDVGLVAGQTDAETAIGRATKKFDDEIAKLERRKQKLQDDYDAAVEADRNQVDMFDSGDSYSKKRKQLIPIDPIRDGVEPKKLNKIIKDFYDGMGRRLDYTKTGRKRAGGWYSPVSGAVVSKKANDLVTASHEGGHAIRDAYDLLEGSDTGMFDFELSKFWNDGYASKPPKELTPDQKLQYKRDEGFAEWFRILVSNPTEAKKSVGLYDRYTQRVPEKVKKVVETFSNDVRRFGGLSGVKMINSNVEDINTRHKAITAIKDLVLNTNKARTKLIDKTKVALDNNRYMAEKAWKQIHKIKGIEPLLGDKNFLNHFKLLRDIPTKAAEFVKDGLRTAKDEAVIDPVTGEAVSIPWAMEPFVGKKYKDIEEFGEYVHAVGIAKRTLEYQRKDLKKLVESDLQGVGQIPPQSVLSKFPDLVQKYQDRINNNINGEFGADRYDLSGKTFTGIGGGAFKDIDVAEKTINEHEQTMVTDPQKYDAVEESLRRYEVYADNVLRYLVDTERMSEKSYQYIKDNNLFYFALSRLKEASAGEPIDTQQGISGSISARKEVVKTATGGAGVIKQPYLNLMELTEKAVSEGDKNRAMLRFVDGLRNDRAMGEGEVQWLAEIGYKVNSKPQGEPIVTVYNKGEKEYWRLAPEYYDAFQATDGLPSAIYNITLPMRIMRQSITNFPTFQVLNRIRDITTRQQISQGDLSFKDYKNRKEAIETLKRLGASQFGHNPVDRIDYYKLQAKIMKEIARDRNTILAIHPSTGLRYLKHLYESSLGSTEIQTRAEEFNSVYRKMKAKGLSDYDAKLEAARASRELLDFKEIGSIMKFMNAIVPFTNARLKGTEAYVKAIGRDPVKTMFRFAMFAMIPQLVNTAVIMRSSEDTKKRYLQLQDWRRDLFYNFPVPGTDWWFTWPKPFESGMVASVIGRVADYYALDDKNAFKDKYWWYVVKNLSPISPDLISGQGAFWGMQLASNYDSFRGSQIVPQYEEDKAVELRKGTETASRLGQLLQSASGNNIDARKIDFAIKNQFGYYGDFALRASNIGADDAKSYKMDPSIIRLVRKNSPSSSKDIDWVFTFAKKYGYMNDIKVKALITVLQQYRKLEDPKAKKNLEMNLLDMASEIRKYYESEMDKGYDEFIEKVKNK